MQARINVVEPNGVKRSIGLGNRPILIGRDPDSDIAISYERASRQHAQIVFDGQRYFVIDLESTNGTFLGREQLPPNTPVEWSPNIPVRIGDIYFNLEIQQDYAQQQAEMAEMETMAGYAPYQQPSSKNMTTILTYLSLAAVFICCCAGLGTVAVFYWFY